MEINRSDSRRRRVLFEGAGQQPVSPIEPADEASPQRRRRSSNYVIRRDQHLRAIDLIPVSWWGSGAIIVGSIVILAALVAAHCYLSGNVALDPITRQAFSLSTANGLGAWSAILGFGLASLGSLQIFSLRRHRRDDYRGTYRIWIVLAMTFALASLLTIVPIDRIVLSQIPRLVGWKEIDPAALSVVLVKLSLLTMLGLRTLIEIRRSRLACLLIVLALVVFAWKVSCEYPALAGLASSIGWLNEGLVLIGCMAAINGVVAYARFVSLDVQGMISQTKRRKRKGKKRRVKGSNSKRVATSASSPPATERAKAAQPGQRPVQTSNPPSTNATAANAGNRPTSTRGPLQAKLDALQTRNNESDDDDELDDLGEPEQSQGSRLSKAERRRLKKLRRSRHAA